LKDGNANTALFHGQAGFRKRKKLSTRLSPAKKTSRESRFLDLLGSALPRAYTLDGLLGSALHRASLDLNFIHREGVDLSALDAAIS